jgi:hypothetical protein
VVCQAINTVRLEAAQDVIDGFLANAHLLGNLDR